MVLEIEEWLVDILAREPRRKTDLCRTSTEFHCQYLRHYKLEVDMRIQPAASNFSYTITCRGLLRTATESHRPYTLRNSHVDNMKIKPAALW